MEVENFRASQKKFKDCEGFRIAGVSRLSF